MKKEEIIAKYGEEGEITLLTEAEIRGVTR